MTPERGARGQPLSRLVGGACLVLAACQVARHSSTEQPEVRLTERSRGSPPPIITPPNYALDERELLSSSSLQLSRPGVKAPTGAETASAGGTFSTSAAPQSVRILTASLAQQLPGATFIPGRSYRLTFGARLLGASRAMLGIKFRTAEKATFRTFQERVTTTDLQQYQIDFSAPAFVAEAELAIDVSGAGMALTNISLRLRAPISNTQPVSSWAASFVPDGYGLVFNDEFNGSELDRKRWFTRFIYVSETLDHLNQENQRYADNGNHRLAGGVLYLTAKRVEPSHPADKNYESGMIRSNFTVRYGFLEARVKMPGGQGVWPAFWLNPDASDKGTLGWPPEIDVFEFVNNGKEDKVNMIHVGLHSDAPGSKTQNTYRDSRFDAHNSDYVAPFNFNDAWHTIAAEWTPKDVSFFVDGLKIVSTTFDWRYHDGLLAAPAHLILNLAIGDEWAGRHGIDGAAFPQALAIDWVRVYRRLN